MPTKFDREEEPNDHMEMPCRCDCGNWFDLNDGYPDRNSNKVVCGDCNERNGKIRELQERYQDLEWDDKPHKREKKKIAAELKVLGAEIKEY